VRIRGVIEGFYGQPWSHAERLDLLAFCGREGLNTWVHGPKDDPFHRARWREPYPGAQLTELGVLAAAGREHGVDVVWAIAPGLDVRYSDPAELETLVAKCEAVRGAGIASIQLLWDDVEHRSTPEASGADQAGFTNRFLAAFPQEGPLVVCPMGYAGTADTPYRRSFARTLDAAVVLYWTGPEVVSPAITREELDAAGRRFAGHELLLWDNYPVNDWDAGTLFLGPLRGRDPRLEGAPLAGSVANGMLQAIPSKLPLATFADWARDPWGYDRLASFRRALDAYGEEVCAAVRKLATAADVPPLPLEEAADALADGADAATSLALLEQLL
jgi:hyaluronoglucosaminidase